MSTSDQPLYAGVDVGAGRVNAVLVRWGGDPSAPVEVVGRHAQMDALDDFCAGVRRIAVDAPGALSAGAHLHDLAVAPKFRVGRCSEIPVPGVPPVPWVTPRSLEAAPGWMRTGFEVWRLLVGAGLEVVETFPAAVFHGLNGRRWPAPKSSVAGRAARLSLLAGLVGRQLSAPVWGHDDIDALAGAVVAARGRPAPHSCPHPDGSALWLLDPALHSTMSAGLGPKMVS